MQGSSCRCRLGFGSSAVDTHCGATGGAFRALLSGADEEFSSAYLHENEAKSQRFIGANVTDLS